MNEERGPASGVPDGSAAMPEVLVIVLNWNSADETVECVRALARSDYPRQRVLVVDNGSLDGSAAHIRARCPDVELLALDRNHGYCGGNNRGIAHGLGEGGYVWLLNPDVRVAPDCLATLIAAAERAPSTGFLGPLVCAREDPTRVLSAGGTLVHGFSGHRAIGVRADAVSTAVTEADYVTGCALLVRRQVVEVVGLLDEDYFLYCEEADWCSRGRRAGYTSVVVPQARAWHPDTASRDADSPLVTYYIARNQLYFVRQHRLGLPVLLRHLLRHIRTLLSWTLRPAWRHKRAQRDALLRALVDAARGQWGERSLP